MRCNIGIAERGVRIVLGLLLFLIGYAGGLSTLPASVVYVLGAIALVTGAVRFCPLWWVFGINTCGPQPKEQH